MAGNNLQPHMILPGAELEGPDVPLPEDGVVVDLTRRRMQTVDEGIGFNELGDGSIEIDFDPGEGPYAEGFEGDPDEHDANLAEFLDASTLSTIAQDVSEWVDVDVASRSKWHERLADGLSLLGVTSATSGKSAGPLKHVEKVNHPLIAEAQVQFQARAIAELVPPTGPVKALPLGARTTEKEEQADRVEGYMNYQLMTLDEDYFPETDRMFFVLSGAGSQFKKVYRDYLLGRNVSRWVRGEDFIVPYGAVTLESAPRYTHQIPVTRNDMRKLQVSGFYRDVPLVTPTEGPTVGDKVKESKDDAQGTEDNSDLTDDTNHTVFECHCYLDLKGFEDLGEDGEPTGVALPYIVSVEKDTMTVLAIRRNWKEADPQRNKRMHFVHFPMFPGDGFYSYGFYHLIGGLGHAGTGLLRTILIGAAFASFQGGFKAKGGKADSNIELEWGVYKDVDMTWEELSRAFYTPPFKEPSEALFKILGAIETAGQRLASTSEAMVGDANNTGPVGTTVALIEQGSKVYTGIHKRLHYAQSKELKLLAELNGEHIPEGGYPYSVPGADREIYAEDFDERVDVIPVSDPNIFSSTQRIAIAQTLVQRATEAPDQYDRRKVEKRFLEAMRVPDPDDVLANRAKVQRADPVTENALMLVGKPAKVFADQDHDAHIAVHQHQMDEFAGRPQGDPIASRLLPAMIAHQAEHMAQSMRMKLGQMMGIQMPMMDLDAEDGDTMTQALPPEIENQIAQRAAMAISKMPKPQGPNDAQAQALEQQAADLQKQAEELDRERQAVDAQKNAVEKAAMKAAYEDKVRKAEAKVAEMQQAMKQSQASQGTKAIVDQAVQKVMAALQKSGGDR